MIRTYHETELKLLNTHINNCQNLKYKIMKYQAKLPCTPPKFILFIILHCYENFNEILIYYCAML